MKRIGLGILIVVIGAFIWMRYAWEDNVDRKANQESEVTDGYHYQPNPRKIPQIPPQPKLIPPAKPSIPQPKPLPDVSSETKEAESATGS
jgi:type IV secretory pathway VirB10-like protein